MSLWTKLNILTLITYLINLYNPVLSANCASASTQSTCIAISGCTWESSSCQCDSSLDLDVVIAMDSSGSIGSSDFTKEKNFVNTLVSQGLSSSARVCIIEFGTDSQIILNFSQSVNMTDTQLTTFVNAISYWAGYTNTVGAIQQALYVFNTFSPSGRSRLFLIITDGNPNMPNGGDVAVCNYANSLKSALITTVIIGVGASWDPDLVDCLVTDTSKYIISVDSFSTFNAILPTITAITCPVSFSLVLTEVQADSDNATFGSRFIEIYNSGGDVTITTLSLSGLFNGQLTTNGSIVLKQGAYLVVYDTTAPSNPFCFNCSCTATNGFCNNAIYIRCGTGYNCWRSSTATQTNWFQTLSDSSDNSIVDSVTFSTSTWANITKGYSYELTSKGYNNADGGNWEMSCTTYGTPGADPLKNCSCVQDKCRLNGDSSATCSAFGSCNCNTGYYYSGTSCYTVPPPGVCYGQHYKNSTSNYIKFIWDKADTDLDIRYSLSYNSSTTGDVTTISTSTRIKYVYDMPQALLGNQNTIIGYVKTTIGLYSSVLIPCYYLTPGPSTPPTPAPTDYPRVWIGGDICSEDRCECSSYGWDCDCETSPSKYHCNNTRIEKLFSESNDPQFISIETWPGDYNIPFTACWVIIPGVNTTSTTNSPDVNATTVSNIGEATADDLSATQGCLHFNGSSSEKISIIIYDESTGTDSPYEYFLLTIVNCTHSVQCDRVYPKNLLMIVEDQVYANSLKVNDNSSSTPGWIWGLLAALLLLLLLIGLFAYRWWVKNRSTEQKLEKTEADLEKEKEENELGFGHDLGQGDVGFNPLATGIPNTNHPSGGLAAEMEKRQAIVPQPNADAPAERFQHRMEYGQTLPEKRKM